MIDSLGGFAIQANLLQNLLAASGAPSFWHWLIFILIIAALIALTLPLISKWQGQRRQKTLRLELTNHGNVRSRYALRATDPTNNLRFKFLLNGTKLHEQLVPIPGARLTINQTAPTTTQQRPAPAASKKSPGGNPLSIASQTANVLSALLSTLGSILPGAMGRSLLQAGAKMRGGRNVMQRTQQATGYATQLAPGSKPASSYNGQGSYYRPSTPAQSYAQPATLPASALPAEKLPGHLVETWWQTPFVEANQTLRLDVSVAPINSFKTQHYPVTVNSRSVEFENAPIVAEDLSFQFAGLNIFERYAPYFLLLTGVLILLIFFLSVW